MFRIEFFDFREGPGECRHPHVTLDNWREAVWWATELISQKQEVAAAVIDCSSPTSTAVAYCCNGFVPLVITDLIAKRAAEVRRELFPEMTTEGPA